VSYKAAKRLAMFDPDADFLEGNFNFTVVVEGAGDNKAVKDTDGQVMASDHVWHFSAGSDCAVGCISF
jgi:hypothetical protein